MGTVDEIAVDVKAKIRDFTENMKDARKEMKKTQDEADETSESTSGMLGGSLGAGIAGGIVGGAVTSLFGRVMRPFSNVLTALLAPVLVAMLPVLRKISNFLSDPENRRALVRRIKEFLVTAVRAIVSATNAIIGAAHAVGVALGEEGSFTAGARQAVSGTSGFLAGAGGGLAGLAGAAIGGGLEAEVTGGGPAPSIDNVFDRGGNRSNVAPGNPDGMLSDGILTKGGDSPSSENP